MKRAMSFILTLALALSMGSCSKRLPAASAPEPTVPPTAEPTPEPTSPPTVLGQTEDMGQDYIDRFVFLGDSTTYGLAYYEVLPHTQVWTPASGTLALSMIVFPTAANRTEMGQERTWPSPVQSVA